MPFLANFSGFRWDGDQYPAYSINSSGISGLRYDCVVTEGLSCWTINALNAHFICGFVCIHSLDHQHKGNKYIIPQ